MRKTNPYYFELVCRKAKIVRVRDGSVVKQYKQYRITHIFVLADVVARIAIVNGENI